MADSRPNSRRWTVIASALLCCGLGLVVIYTKRSAFFSPLACGRGGRDRAGGGASAASLLQSRAQQSVQAPVWLNIVGVVFALTALFADFLGLSGQIAEVMALGGRRQFRDQQCDDPACLSQTPDNLKVRW